MMSNILNLIQSRQSTRLPYDLNHPVAAEDLHQILEAGRWAPTAHNMQNFEVVAVDDPKILETIRALHYPPSLAFIRENYPQLRFSEEELQQKKVGVLGTMFPPSWRNPEVTPDPMEGARPTPPAPLMLFLLYDPSRRAPASEGDFLGIISLGGMVENMWLMAQSLGIAFHIMSTFGSGPAEEDIKKLLNIPVGLKIVFAIRLGYPAVPSGKTLRVRREVEDFSHHNHYGDKGIV
jgi:nitroreductase